MNLQEKILREGDPGYDEARQVWNARFDRRPEIIVQARDTSDVATALELAADRSLPICVKSGGHDYAGRTMVGYFTNRPKFWRIPLRAGTLHA